jgi:hypothetical protein
MRLSRIAASLVALAIIFLHIQPSLAAFLFFSQGGAGSACTLAAPCSLTEAITKGESTEIACADGTDNSPIGLVITQSITIDCAGTAGSIGAFTVDSGAVVTLRNFTMWNVPTAITLKNGTVILDNVHITTSQIAILAQPTSPSSIIVRNSIFDNNSGGVTLKPQAGGSLSARFDHVTISSNTGGGIKIDTTNGPVTVDINDSEISSNGGNGLNAVGGAGGPAIFNISRSVIAKNGVAGVQANGASAAALVDTTLLDSNANGATSFLGGGHLVSYGNNRIVGPTGSGFTGTASLQ